MSKEPVFSNAEQVEAYDRELSQQEPPDEEDARCMDCGDPAPYVCQDCGDYVCGICLSIHEDMHEGKEREMEGQP